MHVAYYEIGHRKGSRCTILTTPFHPVRQKAHKTDFKSNTKYQTKSQHLTVPWAPVGVFYGNLYQDTFHIKAVCSDSLIFESCHCSEALFGGTEASNGQTTHDCYFEQYCNISKQGLIPTFFSDINQHSVWINHFVFQLEVHIDLYCCVQYSCMYISRVTPLLNRISNTVIIV